MALRPSSRQLVDAHRRSPTSCRARAAGERAARPHPDGLAVPPPRSSSPMRSPPPPGARPRRSRPSPRRSAELAEAPTVTARTWPCRWRSSPGWRRPSTASTPDRGPPGLRPGCGDGADHRPRGGPGRARRAHPEAGSRSWRLPWRRWPSGRDDAGELTELTEAVHDDRRRLRDERGRAGVVERLEELASAVQSLTWQLPELGEDVTGHAHGAHRHRPGWRAAPLR